MVEGVWCVLDAERGTQGTGVRCVQMDTLVTPRESTLVRRHLLSSSPTTFSPLPTSPSPYSSPSLSLFPVCPMASLPSPPSSLGLQETLSPVSGVSAMAMQIPSTVTRSRDAVFAASSTQLVDSVKCVQLVSMVMPSPPKIALVMLYITNFQTNTVTNHACAKFSLLILVPHIQHAPTVPLRVLPLPSVTLAWGVCVSDRL